MTTITLSGEVFKDIKEQIERQSERKCENCKHKEKGLELPCISCHDDKYYFEQKPIQFILPEDVFKCSKSFHDDDCYNCSSFANTPQESEDICKGYIEIPLNEPIKSMKDKSLSCAKTEESVLSIVCGECEGSGKGKKTGYRMAGIDDKGKRIETDVTYDDCKSCSAKGSFKVKVRENIEFNILEGLVDKGDEPMPKEKLDIFNIVYRNNKRWKDGNYVFLRVELMKA